MFKEIIRIIIYLISFLAVIFLAYIFTKYLAKKSNSLNRSKNIKIVEGISIGNNSRILIVAVLDKFYIVYDNNSSLLLLDKLDKDELDIQFNNYKKEEDINLNYFLDRIKNHIKNINK